MQKNDARRSTRAKRATNGESETPSNGRSSRNPRGTRGQPPDAAQAAKPESDELVDQRNVVIPPLDIGQLEVGFIGLSPLLVHAWADKSKKQMLADQQGVTKPKSAKKDRDPQADYEASIYWGEDGEWAFPARAFQCAAVAACGGIRGVHKTTMRQAFQVTSEFTRLYSPGHRMRQHMVRLGGASRSADLRYRAEFVHWGCYVKFVYQADIVAPGPIIALLERAGFGIGVGEFRPQCTGLFGKFKVAKPGELEKLVEKWEKTASKTKAKRRGVAA